MLLFCCRRTMRTTTIVLAFALVVIGTIMLAEPTTACASLEEREREREENEGRRSYYECYQIHQNEKMCKDRWGNF